jgi:arsenate reductase
MESQAIAQLSALAQEHRMSVFRLLVRRYPDAVPAGEIAAVLDLRPNTLSSHLNILRQAGLILQARRARSLLYRVDMGEAGRLMQFLVGDCCRGRPDLCPTIPLALNHGGDAMSPRKYRVLFICTGNSARSIFGESILRHEAGDRFEAYSAGTRPYSKLNPLAVEMLRSKGHDVSPLRAKNVAEFQGDDVPKVDFVFTVCDLAANEECPSWPGQPITAHWGLPDPVKARGTDAEKRLAFQQTFGALRNRVLAFAALPLDSLDRIALQRRVDEIAGTVEAE